MYILDAKNKLRFIKSFKESNGDEYMILSHREISEHYMKNRKLNPSEESLINTIECIKEYLKIALTIKQLKDLLVLYPFVRIRIAESEGGIDTDVRDSIFGMICNYVIGSKMPIYGDELTPQEHKMFYEHLHEEAIRVGYKVCIGE